jgi:hypothetical protein
VKTIHKFIKSVISNLPFSMKNAVFWDDIPCGSNKNQHFGGMYCLHHQGDKNRRERNVSSKATEARCKEILCTYMLRLLVTANIVPSLLILVTLMMVAICSFKTSVLTRATWCNIPEDGILHSHRHENLKSPIQHHHG